MKNSLTLFLLIIFGGALSILYGQWTPHIIDQSLPHATIIDVADIDEDGDLDMAANGSPYVRWYQNNSPNTTWTIYNIDNSLYGAVGLAIVDIDGDSTLDVVAAGYDSYDIRWYKNNLPDTNWSINFIDANYYAAEFLVVADIDNDNDPDVVVTGGLGDKLAWFENNLPNPNWTKHIIDDYLDGATNCEVGDIDGDGDLDVAATGNYSNEVCWYENNLPDPNWNKTVIDGNLSGAWGVCITDIDGDDTLDVLAQGMDSNNLFWYKNEDAGQTWTPYTIDVNLNGARNVNVADIDGDDTLDVVATAYNAGEVVWYENQFPNWTKYKIDTNLGTANWVCTADINGDSLLDVVATGRESGKLNWYEQLPVWVNNFALFPNYLLPDGDTLFIRSHITNPESHTISVHTKIFGENISFSDSLSLFDDGLHYDENPNDNVFGYAKWLSALDKDKFKVECYINNLSTNSIHKYHVPDYFTTIGPVVVDTFRIPDTGEDYFTLEFDLRNDDATATATAVTAIATTTDTNVTNEQGILVFGDIGPGQIKSHSFSLRFYTQNNPSSIDFTVNIFSNGYCFWTDSFTVGLTPVGIPEDEKKLPTEYALKQNYPNPFNPSTTFKYSIPTQSKVIIKVFDILGNKIETLVNEEKPIGTYEINWYAEDLPSSIYFYRLQAGDYIETKKMVLMK